MQKHILISVGTIIIVAALIIYGVIERQKPAFTEPQSHTLTKVRIADLPVVHALPFYVALEKGYFTQAGIEVERVKMDAPNLIIDAVLSGQVDMTSPSGALGITGVANFKKPGELQVYAVSGGDTEIANESLVVGTTSTITSLEDLKGKKLGILPGIQWRTISKHLLSLHGLMSDTDVQIVELAPALQAPALASNQVDALLAIEPIPTIATVKGIGKVVLKSPFAHEIASPAYAGAGVIRTEFARENPELTQKILGVFARSIEDIRQNPEAAKQYYKTYTPLEESLIPHAPVFIYKMYNELTEQDILAIQKFYDIFTKHGVVDGRMDARAIIYSPHD